MTPRAELVTLIAEQFAPYAQSQRLARAAAENVVDLTLLAHRDLLLEALGAKRTGIEGGTSRR